MPIVLVSHWGLQVEAAGDLEHQAEGTFHSLTAQLSMEGLIQSATCDQKQIPEPVANIQLQLFVD